MKILTIIIILLLKSALAGCATAVPVVDYYDSDSDTLRRFQIITVFDGESANITDLKNLGEVEGIYCKKTHGQVSVDDRLAEIQAVDQVKLKAAKKGASYITQPQCVIRESGDFTNNCYSTLVCTSSALGAPD